MPGPVLPRSPYGKTHTTGPGLPQPAPEGGPALPACGRSGRLPSLGQPEGAFFAFFGDFRLSVPACMHPDGSFLRHRVEYPQTSIMSPPTTKLGILAPLTGLIVPLESVPDPVFAQRMVGDGVSMDPTSGEVLAPVAGIVTQLHESRHAFTITTDGGIEVLTHVGVDTVLLRGEGFKSIARKGQRIEAGQPVLRFEVDQVARKARSLLTQVLIANVDRVRSFQLMSGSVVAGRDFIFHVELHAPGAVAPAAPAVDGHPVFSDPITLKNALGLHARPSAVLASKAKAFASEIRLLKGSSEANAKSMVAILGLSTRFDDVVMVQASGPDANDAVHALSQLIKEGSGEALAQAAAHIVEAPKHSSTDKPGEASGVTASPGLALGTLVHFRGEAFDIAQEGIGPGVEHFRLTVALEHAVQQMTHGSAGPSEQVHILAAHRELIQDPELQSAAFESIKLGSSAAYAWQQAFLSQSAILSQLPNPALRDRAVDIRDAGQRVLRLLVGSAPRKLELPENAILVAEELTPSEVAGLDRTRVAGFCTTGGGATGHVAILAKAMGIPALCGASPSILTIEEGRTVILDADHGILRYQPERQELDAVRVRLVAHQFRREQERASASAPAVTSDGHRLEIAANVSSAEDIQEALALGADGVGLLRSEFLFEEKTTAPTEDEQAAAYIRAAQALGPTLPLVIRTIDVGGDKPLAYLPIPAEDNPFLGMRGIRVSLDRPDFFRTQLRGLLRAAPHGQLHIMFPMVATLGEFRAAKAILEEEMRSTGQRAKVGVMIEVPAAAMMAEVLAQEADFFSIGTNDLTQYMLAMDRGHPRLAKQADTLEPAVLKMIQLTIHGAHKHGKWVGVCGGIASDPLAIPLLVGLGVDELSVSPPAIPAVKAQIRRLSASTCRQAAAAALHMNTAAEVRASLTALFSS